MGVVTHTNIVIFNISHSFLFFYLLFYLSACSCYFPAYFIIFCLLAHAHDPELWQLQLFPLKICSARWGVIYHGVPSPFLISRY